MLFLRQLTWASNVDNFSSLVKACSISESEQNSTGSSTLQCQCYSSRRDLGGKAVSSMHVHVESTWLCTEILEEDILKVRRLLTTKRTFNHAALASLFQTDFGGGDSPVKGTSRYAGLRTCSLMDFQSLKISLSSHVHCLYHHTFWSWETSTV